MLLDDVLTRMLADSFQRLANTILKLEAGEEVSADERTMARDFANSVKDSVVVRRAPAGYPIDPFAQMFGETDTLAINPLDNPSVNDDDDVTDPSDPAARPSEEPLS